VVTPAFVQRVPKVISLVFHYSIFSGIRQMKPHSAHADGSKRHLGLYRRSLRSGCRAARRRRHCGIWRHLSRSLLKRVAGPIVHNALTRITEIQRCSGKKGQACVARMRQDELRNLPRKARDCGPSFCRELRLPRWHRHTNNGQRGLQQTDWCQIDRKWGKAGIISALSRTYWRDERVLLRCFV